jgi:hypothetical protein
MNYAIVTIGGMLMFTLLAWVMYGRHHFRGPVKTVGIAEPASTLGGASKAEFLTGSSEKAE